MKSLPFGGYTMNDGTDLFLGDAYVYVGYAFTRHARFARRFAEYQPLLLQLRQTLAMLAGAMNTPLDSNTLGEHMPHSDTDKYLKDASRCVRLYCELVPEERRSERFLQAKQEFEDLTNEARGLLLG